MGISVQVPSKPLPKNVRALPLPDFPRALIGAFWRGKKTALLDAFLDMVRDARPGIDLNRAHFQDRNGWTSDKGAVFPPPHVFTALWRSNCLDGSDQELLLWAEKQQLEISHGFVTAIFESGREKETVTNDCG